MLQDRTEPSRHWPEGRSPWTLRRTMQASVAVVVPRRDRRGRRWPDAPPTWRRTGGTCGGRGRQAPPGRAAVHRAHRASRSHRGCAPCHDEAAHPLSRQPLRLLRPATRRSAGRARARARAGGGRGVGALCADRRHRPGGGGLGLPRRAGRPARRARGGRHLRRRQRLPARRGGDGRARHGHRLGQADLPVPRRLPPLGGHRPLPAEPDALHRPPRRGVGGLLVRVGRRDPRAPTRRSRAGSRTEGCRH